MIIKKNGPADINSDLDEIIETFYSSEKKMGLQM